MQMYNDVYDTIQAAIRELAEFRMDAAMPVTTDAMRDDVRDYALDPASHDYRAYGWSAIGEFLDNDGSAFVQWDALNGIDAWQLLTDSSSLSDWIIRYLFEEIYDSEALDMLTDAVQDIEESRDD